MVLKFLGPKIVAVIFFHQKVNISQQLTKTTVTVLFGLLPQQQGSTTLSAKKIGKTRHDVTVKFLFSVQTKNNNNALLN